MQLVAIDVEGLGSITATRIAFGHLTVLAGTESYAGDVVTALELLQAAAHGEIRATLAGEVTRTNGAQSRLVLAARFEGLAYRLAMRMPSRHETELGIGPMMLSEHVTADELGRERIILERRGAGIWLRDAEGWPRTMPRRLEAGETALSVVRAVGQLARLDTMRKAMRSWRIRKEPALAKVATSPAAAVPFPFGRDDHGDSSNGMPRLMVFAGAATAGSPPSMLASIIWRAANQAQVVVTATSPQLLEHLDSKRFPDAVFHHARMSRGRRRATTARAASDH